MRLVPPSFLEVPSISLSEVITSLGWVDILKIDCEGCEYKALRQAAKNRALRHVGMILMEVHSEVRSLVELLKKEGFRITKLTHVGECTILSAQQSAHIVK